MEAICNILFSLVIAVIISIIFFSTISSVSSEDERKANEEFMKQFKSKRKRL